MNDDANPAYMLQMAATDLLVKILSGEIDPRALAAAELASRGLDAAGKWVGFKRAAETPTRRFILLMGRKNAKTTLCALLHGVK